MAEPGVGARSRGVAFGLLLLGSLVALLLASQRWATVTGSFTIEDHLTGNDLTNAMAGLLAGTAAAGAALAALSGPRTRAVLGGVAALLGVAMVLAAIGAQGRTDPATGTTVTIGALGVGYIVAAVVVVVGGVIMATRAHTWPRRPDRFARTGARAATRADDDAGEVWKAMDAGFDPTDVPDHPNGPDDMGDTTGRKSPDRGE